MTGFAAHFDSDNSMMQSTISHWPHYIVLPGILGSEHKLVAQSRVEAVRGHGVGEERTLGSP